MTKSIAIKTAILGACVCVQPALALFNFGSDDNTPTNIQGLSPQVMALATKAYDWAKSHGDIHKDVLTVVDFTKASYEKRLWVINMDTHQVLFNGYVAQGKNSGLVKATRFSNAPGSDESSLGVFETLNEYTGDHPTSLRLKGLEPGINNNAMERAVVVHPAWYVSPAFIKAHHRAGRSWGCFALNPAVAPKVVNMIKGGSVIFAYAPQENHDPNFA